MGKQKRGKWDASHVEYVRKLATDGFAVTTAVKLMCSKFHVQYNETYGRYFRKLMQKKGVTKNVSRIEDTDEFKKAQAKRHDSKKKIFLITSAQSGSLPHKDMLKSMEIYASYIGAEILVIATRYKNPNSLEHSKSLKGREVWAKEFDPYLTANRHRIHKYVSVAGELKIMPTASTPLTGLNGMSGMSSMIIGHPSLHFKSLPVLDGYPSKVLATTGSCTLPDYTDTKAGARGKFHHCFGFVIVECDGEDFHLRHVSVNDNGSFYDMNYHVFPDSMSRTLAPKKALVVGDLHSGETDPVSIKATAEMLEMFNPEATILHDVFSGYSINRHEKKDPFLLMRKEDEGLLDLDQEIRGMLVSLELFRNHNPVVVRSNHDVFLETHLSDSDWRRDRNKSSYLRLASILANDHKGQGKGLIPALIEERFEDSFLCLGDNDSLRVMGWELGMHGHKGASGSRGSGTQFKNLNTKSITAHQHNPERMNGWMSVGTNTKLRLGYNRGLSNWIHGNAIIHPDGKAQLINIINGKFTTLK